MAQSRCQQDKTLPVAADGSARVYSVRDSVNLHPGLDSRKDRDFLFPIVTAFGVPQGDGADALPASTLLDTSTQGCWPLSMRERSL